MFVFEDECPRGRKDCKPISNIVVGKRASFFCCGENDGTSRTVKQDKYTFCFKGPHRDEMSDNDKRDLMHNATVLMAALAWIEDEDCVAYHEPLDEIPKDHFKCEFCKEDRHVDERNLYHDIGPEICDFCWPTFLDENRG